MQPPFSSFCWLSIFLFERPLDLATGVSLGDILPLVVILFSSCDRNFNFGPTVFEIELSRNQRDPFFLEVTLKPGNLLFVEQELPRPFRLVIFPISLFIWRYVHLKQPYFAVYNATKRPLEVRLAVADRLNFGSGQHQARLHWITQMVIVPGAPVAGNYFNTSFAHFIILAADFHRSTRIFLHFKLWKFVIICGQISIYQPL